MIRAVAKSTLLAALCILFLVPAVLMATGYARYKVFVVSTGSMSPSISPNSAVIVEQGVYKVGQTISFMTVNGVVTHRLVERKSDGTMVTKGDANATVDPGTITPPNVIGGVIAAPPLVGYLLMFLKNPLGIASVVLAMVCVWLAASVIAQRREQRQVQV